MSPACAWLLNRTPRGRDKKEKENTLQGTPEENKGSLPAGRRRGKTYNWVTQKPREGCRRKCEDPICGNTSFSWPPDPSHKFSTLVIRVENMWLGYRNLRVMWGISVEKGTLCSRVLAQKLQSSTPHCHSHVGLALPLSPRAIRAATKNASADMTGQATGFRK